MDPPGITRDRYCRPNVTIEDCAALFIQLEPLEDLRCDFKFWRGRTSDVSFRSSTVKRLRDLRPGDVVNRRLSKACCEGRDLQVAAWTDQN